ncbi:MAG: sarcosine oxidase subunit gamma [Rhizobiaceae bacterium]|nr:sarcosine oxidase subunit gamma [Rhizobiaceae bacterium]
MAETQAIHPLAEQLFAGSGVLLKPLAPRTRIALRANSDEIKKIAKILALQLPTKPKSSATKGSRTALWLGPDEWLIIDKPKSELKNLPADLSGILCSAVDISHRNTAITITGNAATNVISAGCPQNLSLEVFPVGACSRTILGKSEIILFRTGQTEFHIECWRSFSDYVWKYLVDAAKSL